jgi:methylaspartate ammonia-lyase
MKIENVILSKGRSSFVQYDMAAIKAGAKPNGYLFDGKPVTPGYDQIVQPAYTVSISILLEDGSIAFGDCADVILAGFAGRDRPFRPEEHMEALETRVVRKLIGRDVSRFRPLAAEFDGPMDGGKRLHTAVRYGVTQALLHATAVSRRKQMAEIIAEEYAAEGAGIATRPVPILTSCMRDNHNLHDRMIIKRSEILPHASFGELEKHVGLDGQKFLDYVAAFARRVKEIGAPDYRPRLHFDVYGSFGELFSDDVDRIADYLGRAREAVRPYELMIEAPIVAETLDEQVVLYKKLREAMKRKGIDVTVIVDEWCNTLEDIRAFGEADAVQMCQIKTPDLGGINNTIEAALYCKRIGLPAYLGGTANETDQSSRITCHIALATAPAFLLSKPGMGADEAFALQTNEMSRTLAILAARASRA